jgi:hypothetical protein
MSTQWERSDEMVCFYGCMVWWLWMDGLSGWCSRHVCVVSLGGEANRLHGVVCLGGCVKRWRYIANTVASFC